ncbi:EPIDERMAL PATTERNING FACTOR-like protein 6 [Raphanus sativus]|uniref:Epidermal patterning factor-like protein n=1 Tax=Raphanus sativus TaxID=3726 RepID=A0A9W3DBU7_RAPSA|nr:EPIDERMAL PATTERNING FACTOR-like protein 6 [Raphanus sativus]KAJ4907378.1 EPIDERMAL PATTERNING FACTOR-like protein 6 [Raphanus sativus]
MGFQRPSSEKSRAKFSLFYIFLLCIILCVLTTFIAPSSLSSPYVTNSGKLGHAQEEDKSTLVIKKMRRIGDRSKEAELRRILRGLGSSPPRCTSKCGRCTPCKPVHVPVPSDTPVTAEYYPEAWRCKCGNKLYMP